MSVKAIYNEDKTKIALELDRDDVCLFQKVMQLWNFKDEEAMLRYFLLVAEDSDGVEKILAIKNKNQIEKYPLPESFQKKA